MDINIRFSKEILLAVGIGVYLLALFAFKLIYSIPSPPLHASIPEQVHLSLGSKGEVVFAWSTRIKDDKCDVVLSSVLFQEGEFRSLMPDTENFLYSAVFKQIPEDIKSYSIVCYRGGLRATRTFRLELKPSNSLLLIGDLASLELAKGDPKYSSEPKPNILKALQNESDYSSIWHLGDIAYDLHSDEGLRGDIFMRDIEPLASLKPYMTIPGNHELFNEFSHYSHHFIMPGHRSQYYSLQMGHATILVINTELNKSNAKKYPQYNKYLKKALVAQVQWLNTELKRIDKLRHRVPWLVVMGHRPLYCSRNKYSEMITRVCVKQANEMRKMFELLFKKHHVDLYISGHLHLYERTLPVFMHRAQGNYSNNDDVFVDLEVPIHIVNGVAGNLEGRDIVFNVTDTPNNFTAVLSESLGYGRLTCHNASHLEYTQYSFGETQFDHDDDLLWQSRRVEDQFWLIKSENMRS